MKKVDEGRRSRRAAGGLRALLGAAVAALACLAAATAWAAGTTITILHVNDTHSHLDSFGPKGPDLAGRIGGIAKAATLIGQVRSEESNVMVLHAGDLFQGDLFFNQYFGVPELQMMQSLQFDAMAVGNHEFGYGPDVLAGVLAEAYPEGGVPLLSANLDLSGYPALSAWISPSITRTYGDVTVGVFGLTTPYDATASPAPVVIEENVVEIAQQQADALRASGATVVVCLSHLGFLLDQQVAANTTGIDFIIGGHDHYKFEHPVSVINATGTTTRIFQAGCHYLYMGELTFTVEDGAVRMDDYELIPLDGRIAPEPNIAAAVAQLKEGIVGSYGDMYGTVIATAAQDMPYLPAEGSAVRDTPVADLVTDAFRARTGTQIAATPIGWLSEQIWEGPIVGADVFHAVSYGYDPATGLGFHLAVVELKGSEILKVLEATLAVIDTNSDYLLQVSGMTYRYDSRQPPGARVVPGSVRVGGRKLDPSEVYSLTVNEGSAMLLGAMGIEAESVTPLPDLEYATVRDFIASLGTVDYRAEGRIRDVALRGASLSPASRSPLPAARAPRPVSGGR